jgi:hypothetical protein
MSVAASIPRFEGNQRCEIWSASVPINHLLRDEDQIGSSQLRLPAEPFIDLFIDAEKMIVALLQVFVNEGEWHMELVV